MVATRFILLLVLATIGASAVQNAWALDFRITLPKRSQLTPVQRLNRQGVEAVRKGQYEKAEAIFYKAYLYDAADPFTLNNLGYISELEGKLDRAQTFYALASKQGSDALIDLSNAKRLEGKPMADALHDLRDVPMRVNRMDIQAMELLRQRRNFEADALLQKALALDPRNPFTLNDIGVAKEATGDFEGALKYYDAAAASQSPEAVVVTGQNSWRGKPVSQMAADSAARLRKRMRKVDPIEARATMFTLRGVSAANQNNWESAKQDFLQAYSLNPSSAFSLNNLGYVAEKDGDLETAELYYSRARKTDGSNARVGLATRGSAEGQHLSTVAADSLHMVRGELERYSKAQREQTGPIQLIPRDNNQSKPNTLKPSTSPTNALPSPQ